MQQIIAISAPICKRGVYQNNKTRNQLFFVQYRDNGYYSIRAFHSNKYLHKANSGYADDVHQWDGYGADNTQWALYPSFDGDYYYIRSKSGNYLDNSGGRTDLGNNVITYNFNGSNAQKWKFHWVGWGLLGYEQIDNAAKKANIKSRSEDAYKALDSINNYSLHLSEDDKKNPMVFLFEGVGASSDPNKRMNAMCVVVKDNKVVYINRNCSTIPDQPFYPPLNYYKENGKTKSDNNMPTLKNGMYGFIVTNHNGYAGLKVSGAKVLRYYASGEVKDSTSAGINVHYRSNDDNHKKVDDKSYPNSAGCQIIGKAGRKANSEYAQFIYALGIKATDSNTAYDSNVNKGIKGKIIIDRSNASKYLHDVGYTAHMISRLNN